MGWNKFYAVIRDRSGKKHSPPARSAACTLSDVTASMVGATKAKSADAMARLLMCHGRLTPEAYRYLEGFLVECPKCGLLNGHRYPCGA